MSFCPTSRQKRVRLAAAMRSADGRDSGSVMVRSLSPQPLSPADEIGPARRWQAPSASRYAGPGGSAGHEGLRQGVAGRRIRPGGFLDAGVGPLLLLPQRPDPLPDRNHASPGDHLLSQSLRAGLHAALALPLRPRRAKDGPPQALLLAHRRGAQFHDDVLLGAGFAAALPRGGLELYRPSLHHDGGRPRPGRKGSHPALERHDPGVLRRARHRPAGAASFNIGMLLMIGSAALNAATTLMVKHLS